MVQASEQDKAVIICTTIAKKRAIKTEEIGEYSLYISETKDKMVFERRIQNDEYPMKMQLNAAGQGNIKFFFRKAPPANDSPSDEEDLIQPEKTMQMDDCVKEGYLYKRGKLNTQWKQRWFRLTGSRLSYYNDCNPTTGENGHINVVDAIIRMERADAMPRVRGAKREWLFSIDSPSRVYQLKADTPSEMIAWINLLKAAVNNATRGKSSSESDNKRLDDLQENLVDIQLGLSKAEELRMAQFIDINNVLGDGKSLDHLMLYFRDTHQQEQLLFWVCLYFACPRQQTNPYLLLVGGHPSFQAPRAEAAEPGTRNLQHIHLYRW
jgi:hypothetical protein